MADEAGKNGPTATEGVFFFNIVKYMKNKAEIDWDAVAENTGFKNAAVAKVRFGQIKRKYGLDSDSPTKKAKKADDITAPATTPTKVTKARRGGGGGRGRGRVSKKEEAEEDEEDKTILTDIKPTEVKEEYEQSAVVKEELPINEFTYF